MESRSQSRLGLPILVTFYLLVAMGAGGEALDPGTRRAEMGGGTPSSSGFAHSSHQAWENPRARRNSYAWGVGAFGFGAWWGVHLVLLQGSLGPVAIPARGLRDPSEDLAKLRAVFPTFDPDILSPPGVRSFLLPAPRAPSV